MQCISVGGVHKNCPVAFLSLFAVHFKPDTYQFRFSCQRIGFGGKKSFLALSVGNFQESFLRWVQNNLKGTFILTEKEKRANRKPGFISQDSTGFIFQVTQV